MKKLIEILLALMILGSCGFAFAGEGESIVFNPATGNYLITYERYGSMEQVTFIPSTKINPILNTKLKLAHGVVHYEYKLLSGRDSQQAIVDIVLDPVSSVATPLPDIPLNGPPGQRSIDMMDATASYFDTTAPWEAFMAYSDKGAFRTGWGTKVANGLPPGSTATFGFKSRDLPGLIQAQLSGYAPDSQDISGETAPDEPGDDPFWKQYFLLKLHDYVTRPAAVPAIAVPTPFNAATLLGSIQNEMHTWIGMNLLNATFSSQLDRYFQSAINAYNHNQPKAARENIEELHKMLMREHHDLDQENEHADEKDHDKDAKRPLIDRLAARVLDFDLKYVLKRVEEGEDKD